MPHFRGSEIGLFDLFASGSVYSVLYHGSSIRFRNPKRNLERHTIVPNLAALTAVDHFLH